MSPSNFEIHSILRNTTQKERITLFRAGGDVGDIHFKVEPEPQNSSFFSLDEKEIVMLADQDHTDYEFGINPQTAPNGTYRAELKFLKMNPVDAKGGTAVSLVAGSVAVIDVTVSGEIQEAYNIVNASVENTEVGHPIDVRYGIKNIGNVDWRPGFIQFAFTRIDGTKPENVWTISGTDLPLIPPGGQTTVSDLNVPNFLSEGSYFLTVTFYAKGITVKTLNADKSFLIVPAGTYDTPGELVSMTTDKSVYRYGEDIKLSAEFTNTGKDPLTGTFYFSVTKGTDVTDYPASSPQTVNTNEPVQFSRIFSLNTVGDYHVRGYAEYGKKRTPYKALDLVVNEKGDQQIKKESLLSRFGYAINSYLGIALLSLVIILGVLVVHLWKKRK